MYLMCKLDNFCTKYSWFYPGDALCPFWEVVFEKAASILRMEIFPLLTTSEIHFRIAVPNELYEKTILIDLSDFVDLIEVMDWKECLESLYGEMSLETHGYFISFDYREEFKMADYQ